MARLAASLRSRSHVLPIKCRCCRSSSNKRKAETLLLKEDIGNLALSRSKRRAYPLSPSSRSAQLLLIVPNHPTECERAHTCQFGSVRRSALDGHRLEAHTVGICKDARAQTSPRWRSPRTSNNSCQSASHWAPASGTMVLWKNTGETFLDALPITRENCCRPRSAGHNFVGRPPRRRANCQVNCILLHAKPSSEWRSFPTTKSRESRPSQRQHPICRSNPASRDLGAELRVQTSWHAEPVGWNRPAYNHSAHISRKTTASAC
jgi:hypothetical protein